MLLRIEDTARQGVPGEWQLITGHDSPEKPQNLHWHCHQGVSFCTQQQSQQHNITSSSTPRFEKPREG
jgi:hypothetical protein